MCRYVADPATSLASNRVLIFLLRAKSSFYYLVDIVNSEFEFVLQKLRSAPLIKGNQLDGMR